MMPTSKQLFLLLLILILPLNAKAHDRTSRVGLKNELRREAYTVQLNREREERIKQLIVIVGDGKAERDIRIRAVKILGDMRASEAAQVLVTNIEQIRPDEVYDKTIESVFVCVPALIKIGKPGARAAMKELRKPTEGAHRLALAIVIGKVEGRKTGRFLFENDIAKVKRADERKNLRAGLKAFLAMTANEREFPVESRRKQNSKR